MNTHLLLAGVLFAVSSTSWATEPVTNDSDLTAQDQTWEHMDAVPQLLPPTTEERSTGSDSDHHVSITVLLDQGGVRTPVAGLKFKLLRASWEGEMITDRAGVARFEGCTQPSAPLQWRAVLESQRFSVTGDEGSYQIETNAKCGENVVMVFESTSQGGQALGIWRIAELAEHKLGQSVGLGFWKNPIQFVWPDDGGDYYSWGRVHITKGNQWDVVGHELGHAIYDQADIGGFGGGPHKIDECYSEALALSEGWASYFSSWLSVALDDNDAKFEYMVPRRAPIRFENVPEDVCAGPRNEWRVNAFLWDMIDLNNDGEGQVESFKWVWDSLYQLKAGGVNTVAQAFVNRGVPPALIDLVWELNFKTKR